MPYLRRIEINGLFGLYDHAVELHADEAVTLVAGPNGIGKTTLLGLTRDLCDGLYRNLAHAAFHELRIESETEETLIARPLPPTDEGDAQLSVELRRGSRVVGQNDVAVPLLPSEFELPPYVEPHGKDTFFDTRLGEVITLDEATYRYGRPRAGRRRREPGPPPPDWFVAKDWRVDFIETKRLDTLISRGRAPRRTDSPSAPIDVYLGHVRAALEVAHRESALTRQRLDRSFVRRLLARAKETVREVELRERYSRVEARADQLQGNGLLSETLELLPTEGLTPTTRRIINLFLDDFEEKLDPLEPLSVRLERLRSIIDDKFVNKHLTVDPQDGIVFRSAPDDAPIPPGSLSSGEQHALALMSKLLFNEGEGTTVLIDEPELSLHVSWQHDMVDDLRDIAEVVGLRFLLATHSTAIINNRWELVEELGVIDRRRLDER